MPDISQITLPSGSTYDIKDKSRIHAVKGTQTEVTSVWTGNIDIDTLFDGLTIAYYLPYNSTSDAVTLTLSMTNNTTTSPVNVYCINNSRVSTHYGAGSTILLTYWSAGSISINGTPTTDDRWSRCDYNTDTTVNNRIQYFSAKTGSKGIWADGLFMQDAYGTYQNICTDANGDVSSSARTTETTKIANTNGFRVGGTIFYSGYNYNANTNISGESAIYSSRSLIDSRYSFNTELVAGSLVAYAPLYLVGTIHDDGLYYLDTIWWTQTPNDSSKVYVLVGGVFDSNTSNCRITLYEQNFWYKYENGSLIELSNSDTKDTTGANNTSSTLYLVGANEQTSNPKTYSNKEIYATDGALTTREVSVGGGLGRMVYSSSTESIDFIFEDNPLVPPAIVYGFHIDSSISDPYNCITYTDNAVGMTPAKMNFSTGNFSYGSWADSWIMQGIKPCILNPSGQVVCYLDPNDFSKDIDGNTVPITQAEMDADPTSEYYHGNVMIEFPKIWLKIAPDSGNATSATIYLSNKKIDNNYKDYAYISPQKVHKEHFYMPAYNGSVVGDAYASDAILRSVSGSHMITSITSSEARTMCQNVGAGGHLTTYSEWMLIGFILTLFGKSLNSQATYGYGACTSGTEELVNGFTTGIHDTKGMFYGTATNTVTNTYVNNVKVLGMENWWGFENRWMDGIINRHPTASGCYVKLCFGTEDGSTVDNYSDSPTGYIATGLKPSGTGNVSGVLINEMTYTDKYMIPTKRSVVSSSSYNEYYSDGCYILNTSGAQTFTIHGGSSTVANAAGTFNLGLDPLVTDRQWKINASPSYT